MVENVARIKTPTKELSFDWEGKPEKIVIRKFGWGEREKLIEDSVDIHINNITKQADIKPKNSEIKILTVLRSLVSAPFPRTREYLSTELEPWVGEWLFNEVEAFNMLTPPLPQSEPTPSGTAPVTKK